MLRLLMYGLNRLGKSLDFKPDSGDHPSGAKQAAEKGMISWPIPEGRPSGAKAHIDIAALTARLKPSPFKATSFSAACKAHIYFVAFTARLKSCPDTSCSSVDFSRSL
jgi:hypothetical protein